MLGHLSVLRQQELLYLRIVAPSLSKWATFTWNEYMTKIRYNFLEWYAVKEEATVGCSMYLAGYRIIFSSFSFSKRASFYYFGRQRSFLWRENTVPFSKYELPVYVCSSTEVIVVARYWKMLKLLDMVYFFSPCLFPHPHPTMLTRPFPLSCPGINILIAMGVKYCQPTFITLMTKLLTNAMGQNHSWAGNSFLRCPEIPRMLWTLLLQYCIHKIL
jgi:hypothetical protein